MLSSKAYDRGQGPEAGIVGLSNADKHFITLINDNADNIVYINCLSMFIIFHEPMKLYTSCLPSERNKQFVNLGSPVDSVTQISQRLFNTVIT